MTPRRSRPRFEPGYGIAEAATGMLDWSWAEERLERSRNYWIGTTGADRAPAVAPVWGVWRDGALHFGTNPRSQKGRNLARDPRVVVHLESGDEVVIVHGRVDRVVPDEATLDAYEEKYGYRPGREGLYRVHPRVALAWLESEYPQTATRFDF
ncbi:MAG: pyridoxamine 5'-phosphate oxidase family protein [Actinomycetota bacterium]|nr:pyridoxamine 5'-phosphate oxidase family protein [Actinomycetota bacterium]